MVYFIEDLPKRYKSFREFDKIVLFAHRFLGLPENLELVIEFTDDLSENTQGEADLEEGIATISLRRNIKKAELTPTIFHEMVHIMQMICGDLEVGVGNIRTKWKGEYFQGDYYSYPWEVEAFLYEENMMKQYAESDDGLHSNGR